MRSALVGTRLAEHPESWKYAGIRVGEAQNPGPATHDGDWTITERPNAAHRRINQAEDSIPSSQDSVTRAVQNLRISDSPAAPAALPAPATPASNWEFHKTAAEKKKPREPREYLGCAQCGPLADAHLASTDGGLMQHLAQNQGGQVLLVVSVGQLRWLNRQACVCCGTTRSHRCRQCNSCGSDTPLRGFRVGRTPSRTDDSPDIRTQRPAVRQPVSNSLRARSQYLQENLWTTARFRTALSGTSFRLTETSSCSPSFAGPRRWHSRDAGSLDTPRLGQKVSKEPRALTSPGR